MFNERVQSRAEGKAETRVRVLAAADRLFREHGFAATTVRRIAAEAEVSTGTVMGVGDKDGLLVAIVDDWIAAVHATREAAAPLPGLTADDAVERVLGAVAPFVAYFLSDGDLSREYAAILARGRHRSGTFGALADELTAEFERILQAAGHDAPGPGARTLYLAYIGVLFAASGGSFDQSEAGARFAEAARQILGEK